ncbi:hypothetical protein SA496_10100 [Pseudomonas sp. JS3066]|jgi:hypothetical protein|uniref:hypothetical protein n=1 Tax=unclassified Pseudomonas TaxID=196821 RepID=UPI000EA8D3F4|nr:MULTISPECIES: hypothetical protein [unclassified Pseudomonas]AYF87014.1 hypothetical protein D6Z43_07545 [Pseudomonas sp. DY-1]MDH4651933.1 hypothetical protein [Pseudomonas sp. BN606]MRK24009.1 hypothetical protein [Pseudomonas sp. JG-B]WVK95491.1 hypothetical protein SA496_10100 [Pseudomonas sp. JS3066]
MPTDAQILAAIDTAFGDCRRPEHFTNFQHCCECAEHDALLCSRDRETLQHADVGNAGWDPICFCSPEGIAYYFPTLARFALAEPSPEIDWYGWQMVFHLGYGGAENALLQHCSTAQRQAVASLLAHLLDTRTELLEMDADAALHAHGNWSR